MVSGRALSLTGFEVAGQVVDPELRVVTIAELGILRAVDADGDRAVVTITPTYSGCPAMDAIRADVETALRRAGWSDVEVRVQLSPPWTTDQITDSGRAKLAAAGIVPPAAGGEAPLIPLVSCPRCGSARTEQLSRFGSTACTSLWRCRACAEPFPHLKAVR